jgi:hypothetical protein
MPSIGWTCKDGTQVSYQEALDMARKNGEFQKFPAPVLQAMHNERVDGDWLSPSSAGGCARQRVLKRLEPYSQDLEAAWTTFTGNAYHREIAGDRRAHDSGQSEIYLEMDLRFQLRDGQPYTMKMQGTADYWDSEYRSLYDWKTIGDFVYYDTATKQRTTRQLPYDSHVLQINLYGMMLRWQNVPVDHLYIWYVKSEGKKNVTRRLVECPIWDMEDLYHHACELAEPLAWYEVTGELPQEHYDPEWDVCRFCPLQQRCQELALEGK